MISPGGKKEKTTARKATKNGFWLVGIFFLLIVISCTDSKYSQCEQIFNIAQSVAKNDQELDFGDRQNPTEIKTKNCPESCKIKIQSYFENLKIDSDKGLGQNPFWTRVSHVIKPSNIKVDFDKEKLGNCPFNALLVKNTPEAIIKQVNSAFDSVNLNKVHSKYYQLSGTCD